jgi:hypothetical protein
MTNRTVAPRRQILENPDAPGTGIIVAAGDEVPTHALGYIENTPNKVDAARNYDVADAADQALNPRPAERVVQHFGTTGEELAEIHDRVDANRRDYDQRMRAQNDPQGWLPADAFHGGVRTTSEHEAGPTGAGAGGDGDRGEPADAKTLGDLKVAQLDELADKLGDGKPDD